MDRKTLELVGATVHYVVDSKFKSCVFSIEVHALERDSSADFVLPAVQGIKKRERNLNPGFKFFELAGHKSAISLARGTYEFHRFMIITGGVHSDYKDDHRWVWAKCPPEVLAQFSDLLGLGEGKPVNAKRPVEKHPYRMFAHNV